MIKYENECVGCGLPCMGSTCPRREVPHLYCDECEEEFDELFEYDGKELCEYCLKEQFERITL